MAWNQPGRSDDKDPKDPWGKRKSDQPDLDQALQNFVKRLRGVFGRRGEERFGLVGIGVAAVAAAVLWIASGGYIVQPGERAVVSVFGRKTAVVDAGVHWSLPLPIARVEKVRVEKASTLEVDTRKSGPGTKTPGAKSKEPREILTQDQSLIDLQFSVQYHITDPETYLLNLKDAEVLIAQTAESIIRELVGKQPLDTVLSEAGRSQLAAEAQPLLQQALDRYRSGVAVE